MISRTNVDLKVLKRLGLFGAIGMLLGRAGGRAAKKGKYKMAARLYHVGTWFYRRNFRCLKSLLKKRENENGNKNQTLF